MSAFDTRSFRLSTSAVGGPPRGFPWSCVECARVSAVRTMRLWRRFPSSPPNKRRDKIKEWAKNADFARDPALRAFGVSVEPTMLKVEARLLKPPPLVTGKRIPPPRDGEDEFHGMQVFRGARIRSWCVVNFSPRVQHAEVEKFAKKFVNCAGAHGLHARDDPPIVSKPWRGDHVDDAVIDGAMREAVQGTPGCELVLVVLESDHSPLYDGVKRMAHSVLGVASQCVAGNAAKMKRRDFVKNIVLQVNTKLDGINCELDDPPRVMASGRTIIFGVSVDAPRAQSTTPVAAVVACINKTGSRFIGRERAVVDMDLPSVLTPMLFELFVKFQERHFGASPDKIVYFRDDASEGDMHSVFGSEMRAIHHAWLMLSTEPPPPITFVLVTRSHRVRAFPHNKADKSGNAPAGKVIDRDIVDPRRFQFFLYGHDGIIGTSRPALYTVLANELGMGAVEMEGFCFDLCHVVGRSTRSVSLVAPLLYAQDLEVRARCLLAYDDPNAWQHGDDEDMAGGAGVEVVVHRELRDTPFFT